jgi:hypothetical protein
MFNRTVEDQILDFRRSSMKRLDKVKRLQLFHYFKEACLDLWWLSALSNVNSKSLLIV